MHIPLCETNKMDILSFSDARHEYECSTGNEYDRKKWIYIPDSYTEYRYILATKGDKPLICLGINPSFAAPGALDPTLKSVERISFSNGFDSFIMLNVYAQRATRPNDMDSCFNTALHDENVKAMNYALSLCSGRPVVWAAWGAIIEKRPYLRTCLSDLYTAGKGADWVHAGPLSKAGHPHHPLYLKADSKLEAFNMPGYLDSLV
ncbi:MAG: DUF1643 domain-containing protein [Oscillospiraceae bacterium]|nr:DUF1643 domain-containing protein [Oscillospiraceae bacterium]